MRGVCGTLLAACAGLLLVSVPATSQDYPFRNTSLPFDQRVKVMIVTLTIVSVI